MNGNNKVICCQIQSKHEFHGQMHVLYLAFDGRLFSPYEFNALASRQVANRENHQLEDTACPDILLNY